MVSLHKLALLITMLSILPAAAQSPLEDVRFVVGGTLGYSNFSFDEKLDHDISFPSVSLPFVVAMDKWQLSMNVQTTLADADISEEEDIGEASRDDIDFVFGYQISNSWTLFAGYKYGKTKIQFTPRDLEDDEAGAITNESYQQEGPFVGVSYSWRFEKAGSLNVAVAYADLTADNEFAANTDDEDEEDEPTEFDDLTGRVSGDTKGLSYSVTWTMPVSSNLLFQTRFKINDYQQDIEHNGIRFNNIDETFTSLHVGLAYVF